MSAENGRQLLRQLCEDLRLMRLRAGGPSLRSLAARLRLGKSQIGSILNGDIGQLPDWDVVRGIVDACRQYAQDRDRLDQLSLATGIEQYWRPRYTMVDYALQQAPRQRSVPTAPADPVGTVRRDAPQAAVPSQLPADIAVFVGRGTELAHLDRLRTAPGGAEPEDRPTTVVICGAAGVGKTAFALRWAHRTRDRYPDGQLYLDLRGYGTGTPLSAADALGHLCAALGVAEADLPADAAERGARLRTETAGRQLLIVLDNAASADQIRPLLPGSGPSTVLVTSRDHLGGLVALDGAARVELAPLPRDDAVALLRQLVGRRAEDDPDSAAVLGEQCGHLPLALRVAAEVAASAPEESMAGIVARLADRHARLELLDVGGDPDAAVREVLSWSLHHLDGVAARAFRRLALHPGPDFDAATVVTLSDMDTRSADRALAVLARGHLVEPSGTGRFRMHDLMRAYAEDLSNDLDPATERSAATGRLLDHYFAGVCRARAVLYPTWHGYLPEPPPTADAPDLADAAAALAWLDREQANLSAVCAHAARTGRPRYAIGIAVNLQRHFEAGRYRDGLTVHSFALDAAHDIGDDTAVAHLRTHVGEIHRLAGRYDVAATHLREALAGHRRTGDTQGQARTLSALGIVAERTGEHTASIRYHRDALTLYRHDGDRRGEAGVLVNLGNAYSGQDDLNGAAAVFEQAHTIFRDLAEPTGQAAALSNLGDVLSMRGEHALAGARLAEALPLFRAAGHRNGEAAVRANLAKVKLRLGAPESALHDLDAALRIFEETGHRYGEASARNCIGEALRALGRHAEGAVAHRAALAIATETRDVDEQRRALAALDELRTTGALT